MFGTSIALRCERLILASAASSFCDIPHILRRTEMVMPNWINRFIGHRKIIRTSQLEKQSRQTVIELLEKGVTDLIFGDHSAFDDLCYDTVTLLKEQYPEIRRIHYRKDYQEIDDSVRQFFVVGYEDSICPDGVESAGKAAYIERNQARIRASDYCIFYFNEDYQPERRKKSKRSIGSYQPKSETKAACEYAVSKNKTVINLLNPTEA